MHYIVCVHGSCYTKFTDFVKEFNRVQPRMLYMSFKYMFVVYLTNDLSALQSISGHYSCLTVASIKWALGNVPDIDNVERGIAMALGQYESHN